MRHQHVLLRLNLKLVLRCQLLAQFACGGLTCMHAVPSKTENASLDKFANALL